MQKIDDMIDRMIPDVRKSYIFMGAAPLLAATGFFITPELYFIAGISLVIGVLTFLGGTKKRKELEYYKKTHSVDAEKVIKSLNRNIDQLTQRVVTNERKANGFTKEGRDSRGDAERAKLQRAKYRALVNLIKETYLIGVNN